MEENARVFTGPFYDFEKFQFDLNQILSIFNTLSCKDDSGFSLGHLTSTDIPSLVITQKDNTRYLVISLPDRVVLKLNEDNYPVGITPSITITFLDSENTIEEPLFINCNLGEKGILISGKILHALTWMTENNTNNFINNYTNYDGDKKEAFGIYLGYLKESKIKAIKRNDINEIESYLVAALITNITDIDNPNPTSIKEVEMDITSAEDLVGLHSNQIFLLATNGAILTSTGFISNETILELKGDNNDNEENNCTETTCEGCSEETCEGTDCDCETTCTEEGTGI